MQFSLNEIKEEEHEEKPRKFISSQVVQKGFISRALARQNFMKKKKTKFSSLVIG